MEKRVNYCRFDCAKITRMLGRITVVGVICFVLYEGAFYFWASSVLDRATMQARNVLIAQNPQHPPQTEPLSRHLFTITRPLTNISLEVDPNTELRIARLDFSLSIWSPTKVRYTVVHLSSTQKGLGYRIAIARLTGTIAANRRAFRINIAASHASMSGAEHHVALFMSHVKADLTLARPLRRPNDWFLRLVAHNIAWRNVAPDILPSFQAYLPQEAAQFDLNVAGIALHDPPSRYSPFELRVQCARADIDSLSLTGRGKLDPSGNGEWMLRITGLNRILRRGLRRISDSPFNAEAFEKEVTRTMRHLPNAIDVPIHAQMPGIASTTGAVYLILSHALNEASVKR